MVEIRHILQQSPQQVLCQPECTRTGPRKVCFGSVRSLSNTTLGVSADNIAALFEIGASPPPAASDCRSKAARADVPKNVSGSICFWVSLDALVSYLGY